jgi:hypothetical protein
MTESTLCQQPSGHWAIATPGREPVNIVADEVFLLEVQGERKLMRVRMEHVDGKWFAVFASGRGQRRAELRDGLRAEFFDQRKRYARKLK